MTTFTPTSFYGARTAIQCPSAGLGSAISTMFMIFPRRRKLATMQGLMAWNAERDAIVNIRYKIGIIRHWFYVMGVNISLCTALLAGIKVALINRIAPFRKIALSLSAFTNQRFATLPGWRFISNQMDGTPFISAIVRAEPRPLVSAIERIFAIKAFARLGWITMRPTFFRAIMRCFRSAQLNIEGRSAKYARLGYLGVFHNSIITPHYVAVNRWADLTGGTPVQVTA